MSTGCFEDIKKLIDSRGKGKLFEYLKEDDLKNLVAEMEDIKNRNPENWKEIVSQRCSNLIL